MKKRILSLLLVFVLIVALLPAGTITTLAAPAEAQTKSPEDEIVTYPVPGGSILFDPATGAVTGYEGAIVELNIPAEINGVDVVTIRYGAFDNCVSLSSVVLPDSLTTIEEFAFANCFFLTSAELPDSLTSLGAYTFTCCADITSITIPDSVMTIGAGAFSGCPMLEGIWVGENNPNYCSDENGVLFNKDKTELVAYPGALAGEYVIPDSVTTIGDSAFSLCDKLIGITIPDSVTSIDDNAFEHCYNLTEVVIPGSVPTIGEYAFAFCGSLTDIIIQEGVTTIGDGAFQNCYGLTDVTIPGSVSYVGATSFLNCGNLIDVTIPEGVTTIGAMAFDSCYSLSSIEIPASVTTIGFDVFYDCYNLTDIYYGGSEEQWNEIDLDDNDFSSVNIHFNGTMPELVSYAVPGGSILFDPATGTVIGYEGEITKVEIPSEINGVPVVAIADDAFYNCDSLTKIALPDSLTIIGDYAFSDCESLTAITFPDSLITIGNAAFYGCNSLSHITIPDSVTTIGVEAFAWCWALERIEISASVTTIGPGAFSGCTILEGIWVDENNQNYSSDENGVLFSKDKTELVAYPDKFVGDYTIPDGVTVIGDDAFLGCQNLTSITIPDGVTVIGDAAFMSCQNLTSITIPDGVTSIGESAFASCSLLTNVTIPDGVTSLSGGVFFGCKSLTTVTIPYGVTTIGDYAFACCWSLESVAIPVSVTTIGDFPFDDSDSLTTICYGGSPEQWEQLDKDENDFSGITIHFCPGANFKDTPIYDNWAHNGIDYCVEQELMNGVGNNLFNPNGTVSRAQLVTILYRMAGSPATEFKHTFTDVANGKWYSKAIEWAAANGVVNGVGDGKFAPDQSITREQIATILYRYHGSPAVSGNLSSFPDASTVSDFATNGMLWATQEGLINGVSSNGVTSLAPQANATRSQIAAIIMRYRQSI